VDFEISPSCMTVICTYRCTAACAQCCFESNPRINGGLDGNTILARISEGARDFPSLRLVVFSGGEPFLLKTDLVRSVAHASSLGLRTRIVSNASWAKRPERAHERMQELRDAGLSELNLSTGHDHQQWVPHESVVNAAEAAVSNGIRVLVTVETDTQHSDCLATFQSDPRIAHLIEKPLFGLQSNFWMPFHSDAQDRRQRPDLAQLRKGCSQVFENVVITPKDELAACCGLTFEHIPEMKLGSQGSIAERYQQQRDDFLKFWLRVDGPYSIIEHVLGDNAAEVLDGVVHQCQACAILHQDERVRSELASCYSDFVPGVMTRYAMDKVIQEETT
jgi:organic radical activating enzyme